MAVHTALPHSHTQVLPFKESLLAMIGICFVVVLVAFDQTVVGTALPTVVAELKGFELYAWVATSYLLTSVVTVPIFGRLGDFYGRKPFVIASIVVFTLASVMCGMAGSMTFLVWSRALQGVGGGMLVGPGHPLFGADPMQGGGPGGVGPARFDPIHPLPDDPHGGGVGGPPGGRGGPDNDELPPPSGLDEDDIDSMFG